MQNNPFTPFFGEVPIVMAGRDQLLRNTSRAFASSMRAPELTMLLSGARGTGKTALLTAMASQAEEVGWVVANVTALPGMLDDIIERSLEAIGKLNANPVPQYTFVREMGPERFYELLDKNPYMYDLRPIEEQRATLRAFQIHDGSGNLYKMAARLPRQTFFGSRIDCSYDSPLELMMI